MPSKTLPPGWFNPDTTNVAWGTDIDRTETVTQSGLYGIHFLNTTPSVDPELRSNLIQVESAVGLAYGALWQTSANGATNWVEVEINGYGSNRTSLLGTSKRRQVLAATGTWEWVGETLDLSGGGGLDVRYIQLVLRKNNIAYHAYVDRVQAEMWITNWQRYRTANQSISASTWTTIDFDANDRNASHGGGNPVPLTRCTEAAGVITIGPTGQYNLSAVVEFTTFTNASKVDIRFKIIGTGGATTLYRYGNISHVPAGESARVVASHVNEHLTSLDTVEVQVWHDDPVPGGVNVVPGADSRNTNFRGVRVGVL